MSAKKLCSNTLKIKGSITFVGNSQSTLKGGIYLAGTLYVERLGTSLDDGLEILCIHTGKYNADGDEVCEFKECTPEELPAVIKLYDDGLHLNEDGTVNMVIEDEDFLGNKTQTVKQVSVSSYQEEKKIPKGENRIHNRTLVKREGPF